jgi:putative addiction module component (TIGR02574 family)
MSYQELEAQALSLGLKERAALAHALLQTLGHPSESEVAALWTEEAERRLEAVRSGKLRVVSGEDARKRGRNAAP